MLDIMKSSIVLFFKGKLFKNNSEVIRQLAIGIFCTLFLFLVLAKFIGLPFAAIVAGFLGGAAQPVLFKDLKFR